MDPLRFASRRCAGPLLLLAATGFSAVPGTLKTDWIGNTFGLGEKIDPTRPDDDLMNRMWVQNYIANIWVSSDGKVFAYSSWDEGSRACGIYKDGKVAGQLDFGKDLFGWDGDLVGDNRYIYTTTRIDWGNWERHGFGIQRYTHDGRVAGWTQGEGYQDSYFVVHDTGSHPGISRIAIDTIARELYVSDPRNGGTVTVFDVASLSQTPKATWNLSGILDMVCDQAGNLWILRGDSIAKFTSRGIPSGIAITSIKSPTRIDFDRSGKLLVFDDSTLQVHRFTDLGTTPTLASTFGARGGIYSGIAGKVGPDKLLPKSAGIGTDAAGNLYIAWGGVAPVAGSDIRSYAPDGAMRWQVLGHTFVACGGFDPGSDGRDIYFRDYHYSMDYNRAPGQGQRYESFHWDRANDTPSVFGGSVIVRRLEGQTILFTTASDQFSGGFRFYRLNQRLATPAGSLGDGSWAWWIERGGDIWNADGWGRIKRFRFLGLDSDGAPRYNTAKPDTFPRPREVGSIQRIHYAPDDDALYVSGYDDSNPTPQGEWGRTGSVFARYDGWTAGARKLAWKILLPLDHPAVGIGPATLKDMWIEGDYAFFITCNSTPATTVYVYSLADGKLVGTILPGPEIAGDIAFWGTYGSLGWVDMAWGIQAFQRANGEYAILFEDDLHAKNVLYRWCPSGNCSEPTSASAATRKDPPGRARVNWKLGRVELDGRRDAAGRNLGTIPTR